MLRYLIRKFFWIMAIAIIIGLSLLQAKLAKGEFETVTDSHESVSELAFFDSQLAFLENSRGFFLPVEEISIKNYAKSQSEKYSISWYQLEKTIQCESNFNQNARGEAGEIGIAQFMPSTWEWMSKVSGFQGDIYNRYDQIDLMVWAFENNLKHHWTCWKIIFRH